MSDDKAEVFDDDEDFIVGRRWDPLGEENDKIETSNDVSKSDGECEAGGSRIKNLESDQEILITSLQALTSHFAQIQFRLRQIVDAPATDRDELLQNLEEFAFKGIPEVTRLDPDEHEHLLKIMENQRHKQFEMIEYLKQQLTAVEKLAYESGSDILPQSLLVEKQKAIIDELKQKLNLNVTEEELPQLSMDEIRAQVDNALGEFVQPLKMKDTLVNQLKTQIVDLERFVAYLQGETQADLKSMKKSATTGDIAFETYNTRTARSRKLSQAEIKRNQQIKSAKTERREDDIKVNRMFPSLLMQASTLFNMFAATQLNGAAKANPRAATQSTMSSAVNHWGNLRAQLEVDVQEIISLAIMIDTLQQQEDEKKSLPCSTISLKTSEKKSKQNKCDESLTSLQTELTSFVRKQFASTLQGLMQHGLHEKRNTTTTLMPFIGCIIPFNQIASQREESYYDDGQDMHVWQFVLEYYHLKKGDQYNETPIRKLSESFNLNISEPTPRSSSAKHSLLKAIGTIIGMHAPYKRSYNSHFKAFVSAGLNSQKLSAWMSLIYQCPQLIRQHYSDDSYVSKTGFRDALRSIDRLSEYSFNLPIDLAIRQFQSITDIIQ